MVLQLGDNQKLVLLGASGGIATGIYENPIFQQALADSKVAALLSSSHVTYNPELAHQISQSGDKDKNRLLLRDNGESYDSINQVFDYLDDENIELVTIDVSNGKLNDFHHNEMYRDSGKIVTANKIPLATCSPNQFNQIVGHNYGAEATVMGGQGIYGDVETTTNAGVQIESIEGVFSGTMGFIMSELEKGRKLSEIIKEAIDKGYTEPNPMDDLDGLDVAKKLVILARRAGHDVSIKDVGVDGLLDDSYREFFYEGWDENEDSKKAAIDGFITVIAKDEDQRFEDWVKKAKKSDSVLRFIASFNNDDGEVMLGVGTEIVAKDSQIGGLSGTDNIAVMKTSVDTKTSIGPGAGIETTATNVMKDLTRVLAAR